MWYGNPLPQYEVEQIALALATAEGNQTDYWNSQDLREHYQKEVVKQYVLYKTFQELDFQRLR